LPRPGFPWWGGCKAEVQPGKKIPPKGEVKTQLKIGPEKRANPTGLTNFTKVFWNNVGRTKGKTLRSALLKPLGAIGKIKTNREGNKKNSTERTPKNEKKSNRQTGTYRHQNRGMKRSDRGNTWSKVSVHPLFNGLKTKHVQSRVKGLQPGTTPLVETSFPVNRKSCSVTRRKVKTEGQKGKNKESP